MAKKKIIHLPGMGESAGPFSRAVLVGDHLYIAGTTALSHLSGDYYKRRVPATIEEQTRLTLENVRAEFFPAEQPISTCYQAALTREDILVEVEAVAVLG